MKQEQRDIGVRTGGDIGDGRCTADARIELAEVDVVGVDIDEHVDLEETAIALLAESIAESTYQVGSRCSVLRDSTVGNISLPHQPPRYGVSSEYPVSSVMKGPTIVPCRVSTASTAMGRGLMRFITFASSPRIDPAYFDQSSSEEMKNVVFPESPYGVCTTRSVPSPASVDTRTRVSHESTDTSTFGTLGAPASLPSWVVTIFESRRSRSDAGATPGHSRARRRSVRSPRRRRPSRPWAERDRHPCAHLGMQQQ